jgi:hypothetical protein
MRRVDSAAPALDFVILGGAPSFALGLPEGFPQIAVPSGTFQDDNP